MGMMMQKSIPVLLFVVLALSGCAAAPAPDPLSGTRWTLTRLNGEPPLGSTQIWLAFNNGRARGRMGCNELDGSYVVNGSTLRLHQIAQSAMSCEDEAIMLQEQEFSTAMRLTQTFVLHEGQRLELQDATGETRLIFTSTEELQRNGR
jgi:heat shock protein HslJ